ncbi:MAG: histidine kinase [Acidobacteria bacterium]|nr:histidine kinase [Acidobacteriota bacterium]
MTPHNISALVNLLGFLTGAALYAMLLAMILRSSSLGFRSHEISARGQGFLSAAERLLLGTALLGLIWNLGALVIYGVRDWEIAKPAAWFEAAVFASLGFLPAVVVHFVLHAGQWLGRRPGSLIIVSAAYILSSYAAVMHFQAAFSGGEMPSGVALRSLTYGFGGITAALFVYARRSSMWKRTIWVVALAVFAVSALHISRHASGDNPWFVELIGHHASLLLVVAILYQDYRFALVDIFLKRAMALIVLIGMAFGLYVLVLARLFRLRDSNGDLDTRAVAALLGLWIGTALIYSLLKRWVSWFVDTIILQRVDYQELRDELAMTAASNERTEDILNRICLRLKQALTANDVGWIASDEKVVTGESQGLLEGQIFQLNEGSVVKPSELVRLISRESESGPDTAGNRSRRNVATVMIPTHENPRFNLLIGELSAGRQLLSDDLALLESVALMMARRIDAVRVTHERCERNLREKEISKLATEAELRALRAQLNPHFLFNALTTIGYLIQTNPGRALETLLKLTGLLRAVLRAPAGELITIGDEMDLVESYLAIERERFEDRLRVVIDLPQDLRDHLIPPLIVQPLVENAIKHGIGPIRDGGQVFVCVSLDESGDPLTGSRLRISVQDTGEGVTAAGLEAGRMSGVGLANVEKRLECFYGAMADFRIAKCKGGGTLAEIRLPAEADHLRSAMQIENEPAKGLAVK